MKLFNRRTKITVQFFFFLFCFATLSAQQRELNTGWKAMRAPDVMKHGSDLSRTDYRLTNWLPAAVPGTVLTTLLNNDLIPDPFFGMNNKQIQDIYTAGRDNYTYWFVNDFTEAPPSTGEKVWLIFRGVNNSFNVFMNGQKIPTLRYKSMFLRQQLDITPYLSRDGHNRIAVIVYPPDQVGNPNGGQGGDGMIAHGITAQYTAGWDWIQPIADRNTGIWDKVYLKKTGTVTISQTHVTTLVPGKRTPGGTQAPAIIKVTVELDNISDRLVTGEMTCNIEGQKSSVNVILPPHIHMELSFPDLTLQNPKLWWPNGYGDQPLYNITTQVKLNDAVSDEQQTTFGIRELNATWNTRTKSRELYVNGQRIFIKGGNRILSDELLRFSDERYDAEVRFHRDMNLNMIRVWGGGITERPEFYDACDKYGILVMQDLWVSGDCNGRWYDPLKLEDTTARRNYPDDHSLFIASVSDQVKMLRNHPSLAFWCGGNEIKPPADILAAIKDTLLRQLDTTRFFFDHSNADSMSYHSGDGPYTIQPTNYFWEHHSFPFNSEVGSVGVGDYESLERFLPKQNMVAPYYSTATRKWIIDSVWKYHKYIGYDSAVEVYGHPHDVRDFAKKAQLINYDQYRALIEGATSHMWDWYTGIMIWKTQNPWTAMVGQMYDVYLDPNACLYGLSEGSKPLHIMYNPISHSVMVANNSFRSVDNLHITATVYSMDGAAALLMQNTIAVPPSGCEEYFRFKTIDAANKFLYLSLTNSAGDLIDENLYWLPDAAGNYSGLSTMPKASINASASLIKNGLAEITITAPKDGPVAFFSRISLVDRSTKKRILPVFYNNNYISVLPGQSRTIQMEFTPAKGVKPMVSIEGWNVDKKLVELKK